MLPSLLITLLALAAPHAVRPSDHPLPIRGPSAGSPRWYAKARHLASDAPSISVWLNSTKPYQRGEAAQVFIRTDRDAYVTVVRIDTDGRVRMLFPIDPWDDNFARAGKDLQLIGRNNGPAFSVDDDPGVGYVFAIASPDPFTYDHFVMGDHWDYRVIADGRIKGDPYVAVTDFAAQIAPQGNFNYDLASYDVQQHYDYPRFVCYDCHAYTSYAYWNPYLSWCSSFQMVIYDNPFYYPYGAYPYGYVGYPGYYGYIGYPGYYGYPYNYYGYPYNYYGPGVVVGRPLRPPPRYVFKDWNGSGPYVTRIPERPRGADGQWVTERRRTGAEFGGPGSVPVPTGAGGRMRQRTPNAPQIDQSRPEGGGARRAAPQGGQPTTPGQGDAQGRQARPDNRGRGVTPPGGQPNTQGRQVQPDNRGRGVTPQGGQSGNPGGQVQPENQGRRSTSDGGQPARQGHEVKPDDQGRRPPSRFDPVQEQANRLLETGRRSDGSGQARAGQTDPRSESDGAPSWATTLRAREQAEPTSGGAGDQGRQPGGRRGSEAEPRSPSRQSAPSSSQYSPRQAPPSQSQGRSAPPQGRSAPPQGRSAPSQGRSAPPPRPTGEPQLRRRSP
jgi:hypothetical protein